MLAQYTERGKGILGSGIELGGLFNNVKINVDSYQKVIDDFKKIGDFSKYWEKDKFNWDAIAKAIEGCDETALSYFKTLDDGNGTINNQSVYKYRKQKQIIIISVFICVFINPTMKHNATPHCVFQN